tara:strand:- start:718 stop:1473 length:756 start_codon:yes stop_codon:yes gene_type:complete
MKYFWSFYLLFFSCLCFAGEKNQPSVGNSEINRFYKKIEAEETSLEVIFKIYLEENDRHLSREEVNRIYLIYKSLNKKVSEKVAAFEENKVKYKYYSDYIKFLEEFRKNLEKDLEKKIKKTSDLGMHESSPYRGTKRNFHLDEKSIQSTFIQIFAIEKIFIKSRTVYRKRFLIIFSGLILFNLVTFSEMENNIFFAYFWAYVNLGGGAFVGVDFFSNLPYLNKNLDQFKKYLQEQKLEFCRSFFAPLGGLQ